MQFRATTGAYVPVHYGDLAENFIKVMGAFIPDLVAACEADLACADRLKSVLQTYVYQPSP